MKRTLKCRCGGRFAADVTELGSRVTCPHCGSESIISKSKPQVAGRSYVPFLRKQTCPQGGALRGVRL